MSHYEVRLARAEDDEAIGELLVAAFVQQYARKMPEVTVTGQRKATLRDVAGRREAVKLWVALQRGAVVGTVALWPPGVAGSEAWLPGAADVRHLAVDRAHRGGPVSRLLLDEAEGWARAHGCARVCLHIRHGAHGLARLYESRGYVRAPEGDLDQRPEVLLDAYVLRLS